MAKGPKILGPFDRNRIKTKVGEESLTEQSHAADCDVNNIMKKYARTGLVTHARDGEMQFFDCTTVTEYQDACNLVIDAKALFDELPAELRARFDNDPIGLLEFIADPGNEEEARELGLIEPSAPVAPEPAPQGDPPAADSPPAPEDASAAS